MRPTCALLTLLFAFAPLAAQEKTDQDKAAFTPSGFTPSAINDQVVKEFNAAWRRSRNGKASFESLLLIFLNPDGSYRAASAGITNQYKRFTFTWDPLAIAIVHTHPNDSEPRPQEPDRRLADRLGVPIMTITIQGMYMYDPAAGRTTKLQEGLDWLDRSKWARGWLALSSR